MPAVQPTTEAMPLPARLIDSAMALARAEVALVLIRTRELAVRAVTALLATILAAAFAQTALLLLVLSPFLARAIAVESLVVAIVLSLGIASAAAIGAFLSWRNVHRSVGAPYRDVPPTVGARVTSMSGVSEAARPARPVELHRDRSTTPVTLAERMS